MSYSLARKEFECKSCVPARTIKMLVGGDTQSVICDECRQQAYVKVKNQTNIEEQKITSPNMSRQMPSRRNKRRIIRDDQEPTRIQN